MQKFIYIFLIVVLSLSAFAQDKSDKEQTLLGNDESITVSGYGAPEIMFTRIFKSEFGIMMGGRGGVILNHSFIIGGGGYGLVSNHRVNYDIGNIGTVDTRLMFGYGGLHLGYVFSSNSVFHLTLGALIGGGGAGTSRHHGYDNDNDWSNGMVENTGVFVFQPSVGGELNVTKFLRMELTAGYRLVSGSDLTEVTDNDLSCFYLGLALKFGKF
jgi:hypothetical protein